MKRVWLHFWLGYFRGKRNQLDKRLRKVDLKVRRMTHELHHK